MSRWMLRYLVHCDFLPFREWNVEAESESEARLMIVNQVGVPYEETSATLI